MRLDEDGIRQSKHQLGTNGNVRGAPKLNTSPYDFDLLLPLSLQKMASSSSLVEQRGSLPKNLRPSSPPSSASGSRTREI